MDGGDGMIDKVQTAYLGALWVIAVAEVIELFLI